MQKSLPFPFIHAECVTWGDFDGDGDPDLAVVGDDAHIVYRNDGGILTPGWILGESSPNRAYSAAWGDFDNDCDLDPAVGVQDSVGGGRAEIYRNDFDPQYHTNIAWTSAENNICEVAWADWDGDGDPDLAAGDQSNHLRVYRNDGGTLTLAWTSAETNNVRSLAWADWDGDGDPDLAVGNYNQPNRIYRNDGGSLTLAWTASEIDPTSSVAWGDWDGDGDPDLAVGTYGVPNRVYQNDGGNMVLAWSSSETDWTDSVTWGDRDGDGDPDLASDGRVYQNDGGTLGLAWTSPSPAGLTVSVEWGDLNGDAMLELAEGNNSSLSYIYSKLGSGMQRVQTIYTWNAVDVAWGDFDGDGDQDLAVGEDLARIRLYRNDAGKLNPFWQIDYGAYVDNLAWADFDGDGDQDLAVGNVGAHPARVYEMAFENSEFLYAQESVADTNGGTLLPCETVRCQVAIDYDHVREARGISYSEPLPAGLGPATITGCYGTIGTDCYYDAGLHEIVVPGYPLSGGVQGREVVVEYEAETGCDLVTMESLCAQGTFADPRGTELLTDGDGYRCNGSQPACIEPCQPRFSNATIAVTDDNGGALNSGDPVTFAITFENDGCLDATGVVLADDVDETHYANINVAPPGQYSGGVITWGVGDVPVGAQIVLTFSATIQGNPGEQACNRAALTAAEWGLCTPECREETSEVCPAIGSAIHNLTSAKTWVDDSGGELVPGSDTITGTITVSNLGLLDDTGVTVTDYPDLDVLENILPLDGGVFDGSAIAWNVGDLGSGNSAGLRFTATVRCNVPGPGGTDIPIADGAQVCNAGYTAASHETGRLPGTPPASCLTVGRPVITIQKEVTNSGPIAPGDSVEYRITLCNAGLGTGRDVVIRDTIDPNNNAPPGSWLVGPPVWIGGGGQWFTPPSGPPYIEWTVGTLAPGDPDAPACGDLSYAIQVDPDTEEGTIICNEAEVRNESLYQACGWSFPASAADCQEIGSSWHLHKKGCSTAPCDIGTLFPLPEDGVVPAPPNQVSEAGLTDTATWLCFYEIRKGSTPATPVRIIKSTVADSMDLIY